MQQVPVKIKPIPSTIQRSRLSKQQQAIFDDKFNQHCLNLENIDTVNTNTIYQLFSNKNKLILDIGFGNGEQLFELATKIPHYNFIGVELYKKGIVNLINKINQNNLTNIKIIFGDIKEILNKFDNQLFYKIQIFFPDPWPKLRHHKRRLIKPELLNLIKYKLMAEGILHIVTDSQDYAIYINKYIQLLPTFVRLLDYTMFRPTTKFEKIAKSKGNDILELVFLSKFNIIES